MSDDKWSDVLVLNSSLELFISTFSVSIIHWVVLQITFTSLVADRTVQRMVDQKELHDASSGKSGNFRICIDFHCGCDLGAAWGHWLGWLLYFDEAHSAVTCDFKSFMIAKSWDFDSILFGSLVDWEVIIDLVRFSVDEDLNFLGWKRSKRSEKTLNCFKFG